MPTGYKLVKLFRSFSSKGYATVIGHVEKIHEQINPNKPAVLSALNRESIEQLVQSSPHHAAVYALRKMGNSFGTIANDVLPDLKAARCDGQVALSVVLRATRGF